MNEKELEIYQKWRTYRKHGHIMTTFEIADILGISQGFVSKAVTKGIRERPTIDTELIEITKKKIKVGIFNMANTNKIEKELYFENEKSWICYTKDYFLLMMERKGIKQMNVYEAVISENMFYCVKEEKNKSKNVCGKQCPMYEALNGIGGCCRYYRSKAFEIGNLTTIK